MRRGGWLDEEVLDALRDGGTVLARRGGEERRLGADAPAALRRRLRLLGE
jgi:hypothetical protein